MQLFYAPDMTGGAYLLNEEESKHCIRVLRKKNGDVIHIIDGRGGLYRCRIVSDDPRKCALAVEEYFEAFEKRPYTLHLAVAPTKNIDRFEWFLEKATEIGVDAVTPLVCDHSERKVIKTERSEKVITAAVKQSLKAYHPAFEPMTSFAEFVGRDFGDKELFIAHCEESDEKVLLNRLASVGGDYVVLIGPEGDFSIEEIALAKQKGFQFISLGKSRLRTETAGVMAAAFLSILNQ